MGMQACIVTSTPAVKSFGEKLGFTAVEYAKLRDGEPSNNANSELLQLLGFQDGKMLDTGHFDLVFVHLGTHVNENGRNDLEYVNSLVKKILELSQPGSEIRLHLTLIMSFRDAMGDYPNFSLGPLVNSDLPFVVPRQSYTLKGVNLRNGIRHRCPMLITQWQDAVTRKNSGNLAVTADRFLYEVAFKLWKAPKYGA